jgi:hypothetical protein
MFTIAAHHSTEKPQTLISVKHLEPSTARGTMQIADAAELGMIPPHQLELC